jgi:4-carboxymuconolactone decarboxylase
MPTGEIKKRVAPEQIYRVTPALGRYTDEVLFGRVWPDAVLAPRDRSLVTLSILVSTGKYAQIASHARRGLENGLSPVEISELVTHLAFYSGWPNAMSSVPELAKIFDERGIRLAEEGGSLPAFDPEAEASRKISIEENVAPTAPGLASDTDDVLFADLWLRPQLVPRDRSLVTMAALIGLGQAEQLTFHVNRAMDNGLTGAEAGEVLRQAAYYAGWPRAMSAVGVLKAVVATRKPA